VSDEHLTSELAVRAMRCRRAPCRYLKPDGGWTSRSGFRPLVDVKDALKALDTTTKDYSLVAKQGVITVEVRLPERTGQATGKCQGLTISLALAKAHGIDAEAGK
jgi:hypothetical protein